MLLAYEAGAKLIVAVGTHDTMVEFLDKGRAGMSSTFLTRLRIGPMLVDAKGVARLYEPTVRRRDLVFLVLAALLVMVVITLVSPARCGCTSTGSGSRCATCGSASRTGSDRVRPRSSMISFRFHVVSITAIFLAIAIGVVVGSTYRRRRSRSPAWRTASSTVEGNVAEAREENARLEEELDAARQYIDRSADFAVTDRLTDVPVMVVAARGVDEEAVERTVRARPPGRRRRARHRVARAVAGRSEADEELDTLLARSSTDRRRTTREDLWAEAWQGIADELAAERDRRASAGGRRRRDPGTTEVRCWATSRPPGSSPSTRSTTTRSASTDLAGVAPRMLFITGARALRGDRAGRAHRGGGERGRRPRDGRGRRVRGGGGGARPGRGRSPSRSTSPCWTRSSSSTTSTSMEGQVASVLALDSAADGQVGVRYGFGEGADAVLPAWTAP